REEQALRDRAVRQLMDRLASRLSDPRRVGPDLSGMFAAWSSLYPELMPVIAAHREELRREGWVCVPIAALPPGQRDAVLAKLRPLMREMDERIEESWRRRLQDEGVAGRPLPVPIKPPAALSAPETSTLTVGL